MRKDRIISIVILCVIIVAIVLYISGLGRRESLGFGDVISVVYLEGTIGGDALQGRSITAGEFKALLNDVRKEKPAGVVIRVDSPGGLVTETEEIFNALVRFKKDTGVKVYVSMGAEAASGGYYVACVGDRIFATKSTITGSIGVVTQLLNYEELMNKLGIRSIVLKSGSYKDMGSPYRELTEEEKKMFQDIVDLEYESFLQVVAESRKLTPEDLRKYARGQIFLGLQAKEIGLVDELGDLEDTIGTLAKNLGLSHYVISEHTVKRGFLSLIASLLNYVPEFLRKTTSFKVQYIMQY